MDSRYDNVPKKVLKLMQKEEKRRQQEKKRELREQYCSMFEELLEDLGKKHWGITLEEKMAKYPKEAWETLKRWASRNEVKLVYVNNNPYSAFNNMLEEIKFKN